MNAASFHSVLAGSLDGLVRLRQSLGFEVRVIRSQLAHFDRFLCARQWKSPYLTRELIEAWASSDGPIKPISRAKRLHTMRILGRFIAHTEPESYIPGPAWGPRQATGFRPHIYSPGEIDALLTEAARLTPAGSLGAKTYVTLLSLLICTGLRISEALALTLADVDLVRGILWVRESKFHKSRALPLHPTAVQGLSHYRQARDAAGNPVVLQAPFFVSEQKRPLPYWHVCATFLQIARRSGVRGPAGQKGPRIHDIRHSFATSRLLVWYRDGQDVQARLPLLTTYMGHVSIVSTQVYIEATAELLEEAAKRFTAPRLYHVLPSGGLR